MSISRKKFIILFIICGFVFLFIYNSVLGPEVRGMPRDWSNFLLIDPGTSWQSTVSTILLPVKMILVAPLMPYLTLLNDDPPPPFIGFGFVVYWAILASVIYYLIAKIKERRKNA